MPTPANLGSVTVGDAEQFFTNYFTPQLDVAANVDDAIVAFFSQQTGSTVSGRQLASAVIYTAISQHIDPMVALDQFKQVPQGDLNAYLCMFLNFNRVGTSYLGVTNQPMTNKYVKRAIML